MSSSLQSHGLQHVSLPCPSLSPRVCSNYVYGVGDAIQPSHLLSPPSSFALNLFQHQSLLQSVGSSQEGAGQRAKM